MALASLILASGFYVEEGQCWRMVRTNVGHPSHCQEPVGWRGRYVNPKGKRWTVWSCEWRLEELEEVRPLQKRAFVERRVGVVPQPAIGGIQDKSGKWSKPAAVGRKPQASK